MKKILEFLLEKNRWAIVLALVLILIGVGVMRFQHNRIDNLKDKYTTEVNLKNALLDTVNRYQNKQKEWVVEKLTIQTSLKDFKKMNGQLTIDQKRLLNKINDVNNKNNIITAALIRANFVIDSLLLGGTIHIDTTNKTIEFLNLKDSNLRYDFFVSGVLPYPPNSEPSFFVNKLILPNEQFIEFHWTDNKKDNFPISFSVSNSNKYVKVYDINSYAIPNLKKETLNPTGWEKISQWISKNGKIVGYVAGGVIVGASGTYILLQ